MKNSPLTLRELKSRNPIQASVKFPEFKAEVGRIWYPERQKIAPVIRQVEGEHAYAVVEVIADLAKQVEPPAIKSEDLLRQIEKIDQIDLVKYSDGVTHEFLNISFLPTLTEKIKYQPPKRDEDKPSNVFGTDTRYIFDDVSYPWCTVGRVETASGSGTGCMIGRNLMLTCSHCIVWNSDGSAGWIKFSPSYHNGVRPALGSAWGTRVIFWNKAEGGLTDLETAFDYVVVVLDRNLGDVTGYAGYRTYDDDWNGGSFWQHIGYPGDLTGTQRPVFFGNGAISSVSNQSISDQTGYVLGHFMDITGGHSGGPVWGWWGSEIYPRVIGVQSAEASIPANNTSGDNEGGGGPAMSKIIGYARANYGS
ncbi:trypsin-like serine peptidase [Brunnivagina elsteri]|uniref:Serine protease n=1 Tax=Brunnivagina elsteri CCALA 953 TaxID=987040 RepID=A0A2A2TJL4_9CYAN|nr:trypsin-like peptidase domain-containing protein [Calothrix elsteri]PAX54871.1 hypothetical protein CK510_11835 [Calothrix elsteri CCALA 953]